MTGTSTRSSNDSSQSHVEITAILRGSFLYVSIIGINGIIRGDEERGEGGGNEGER